MPTAVSAFGVGAMIWQLTGNALMKTTGPALPAWQTMGLFAAMFCVLMWISVPFIRAPPPGFQPPPPPPRESMSLQMRVLAWLFPTTQPAPIDQPYKFLSAVVQLEFLLICASMFALLMPGAVFLSSAADMTMYVFHQPRDFANTAAALLVSATCHVASRCSTSVPLEALPPRAVPLPLPLPVPAVAIAA